MTFCFYIGIANESGCLYTCRRSEEGENESQSKTKWVHSMSQPLTFHMIMLLIKQNIFVFIPAIQHKCKDARTHAHCTNTYTFSRTPNSFHKHPSKCVYYLISFGELFNCNSKTLKKFFCGEIEKQSVLFIYLHETKDQYSMEWPGIETARGAKDCVWDLWWNFFWM